MDNLTHTLTGAALGAAGLGRRTRLAMPALLLGANAPDIDAAAYFVDPVVALDVRRGLTHGVLAMVVLPVLLTGLLLGIDAIARRSRRNHPQPPPWRALLAISAVAILSHPLLDLLNTYGVRLLAPFSWRWFYADTLFIVDPWVLLALIAGLLAARRMHAFAARTALGAIAAYATMMFAMSGIARWWVREGASPLLGVTPRRILASPVPVNPFARAIVVETDSAYYRGRVSFLPPRVALYRDPRIERGRELLPLIAGDRRAQAFLRWSRFPVLTRATGVVVLADARYGGPSSGWARVEVPLPRRIAAEGRPGPRAWPSGVPR